MPSSPPPRTPCYRSKSNRTSLLIRGAQTSPSQHPSSSQNCPLASANMEGNGSTHRTHHRDPEIQRAQEAIEDHFNGRPFPGEDTNLTFSLSEESYGQLRQNLSDRNLLGHLDDEIRSDWDADTGELMLRAMLSITHESSVFDLTGLITGRLDTVAENDDILTPYRSYICPGLSARVKNSSSHNEPDMQFRYNKDGNFNAPFVIEVAYSQRPLNLRERTLGYFEKYPSVCAVLGFHIDYHNVEARKRLDYKTEGRISFWTAARDDENLWIHCHKDEDVFCREDGTAVEGDLKIPFKWFVPQSKRMQGDDLDEPIVLDYAELTKILTEAGDYQRDQDNEASSNTLKRALPTELYDSDGKFVEEIPEQDHKRQRVNAGITTRSAAAAAVQPVRRSERTRRPPRRLRDEA